MSHASAWPARGAEAVRPFLDRAYVLGDEHLHREAAYTALSRGRHHNQLYTIEPEPETHVIDPDIIRDAIRHALERSGYKSLATEWQPPARSTERSQDAGMELSQRALESASGALNIAPRPGVLGQWAAGIMGRAR